jgi:phenylacetate-CoA ligase
MKHFIDLLSALRIRSECVKHEWSREKLDKFQQTELQSLVRHAIEKSPFYRQLYKDIVVDDNLAVTDLPATNKTMMMDNYDQVVTDSRLKLKDLQAFISQVKFGQSYLNQYRVFTTSGSTGRKGVFVFNRDEWIKAVSTGLRVGYYCGIKNPRLFPKRWRFALIGAGSPLHVTASYYHAINSVFFNQVILPVTAPFVEIVTALNRLRPDFLSCYPSLASLLAIEQLDGRLDIHPIAITTNSETRTPEMQQNIENAWGIAPFNNYGTTEAGVNIAIDCDCHCGLHIFEDFFIVEVVDEKNDPVPDGQLGAKILFTNLYNYTQPIIRYEIDDVIALSAESCACGHPFKMIADIEGRADDILYICSEEGEEIPVHPHNLRSPAAEITEIKQYQISQETDGLHITLALKNDVIADEVTARLEDKYAKKLASLGVQCPRLHIDVVDFIERDHKKMGKFKLIKSNAARK